MLLEQLEKIWLDEHSSPIDLPLNHYTNEANAESILRTKVLWATDYTFQNDWTEILHGRDLILSGIRIKQHERIPQLAEFLDELAGRYLRLFDDLRIHPFIVSLSESDDDMSQWRSYGDQGRGYSLGFLLSSHSRMYAIGARNTEVPIVLRKVYYRTKEKLMLLGGMVTQMSYAYLTALKQHQEHADYTEEEVRQRMVGGLLDLLLEMAYCFKREQYISEKEWRLIVPVREQDIEDLCEQTGDDPLKFFYPVTLFDHFPDDDNHYFPLNRVMIGPLRDEAASRQALDEIIQDIELHPPSLLPHERMAYYKSHRPL